MNEITKIRFEPINQNEQELLGRLARAELSTGEIRFGIIVTIEKEMETTIEDFESGFEKIWAIWKDSIEKAIEAYENAKEYDLKSILNNGTLTYIIMKNIIEIECEI